jgi:Fur family transcriptional regulator, peroxide stress response regulator
VARDKSRRLSDEEFDLFRKVCKERGIKVTPQRTEIFREIMRAHDHPCAEDIYTLVKDRLPSISLDTVYRTLSTFESCGLISRVQFLEDKTRFDPNRRHHHHMFCTVCRSLTDFYWPDLDNAELPSEVSRWGRTQTTHLQVRGECSKCSRERNRK